MERIWRGKKGRERKPTAAKGTLERRAGLYASRAKRKLRDVATTNEDQDGKTSPLHRMCCRFKLGERCPGKSTKKVSNVRRLGPCSIGRIGLKCGSRRREELTKEPEGRSLMTPLAG